MKNIGFIGVGVMGKSMVRNLMKAGFNLSVYTRTPEKAAEVVQEGAKWCASVAECVAGQDAVITIVGYPKDVEEVYFGEKGILENAKPGAYLIDMTTTSPKLSVKIYEEAKKRGMFALDAPVSGGDVGARLGTLAIMTGGDKEAFEACGELFAAMGKNIRYEGPAGCGQHCKMANQIALAGAIASCCEAMAYAKRAGLDVQEMLNTISTGAAGSWQMTNMAPRMLAGDLNPGFFVKHYIKHMHIAIEESEARDLHLSILNAVNGMYEQLAENGMEDLGTQALIKYFDEKEQA